MGFAGICFEISTSCPKCKGALPLNGISESVLCDACRTPFPTPQATWESLLGDAIGEALASEIGSGRNATIFSSANFSMTYGRQDPRCNPACKEPFSEQAIAEGARTGCIACTKCGKRTLVRSAPAWMRGLHPKLALLVGETTGAQTVSESPGQVRFHCYHCGGSLPLDGSTRSVRCAYCGNPVMVPDDIWVRMNPVRTVDRWYAVLDIDLSRAAGALPEDVSEFCDFEVEPGGNLVVAWIDDEPGSAGHPARIALVDGDGLLRWKQDGVEFTSDARLYVSPGAGTVWLADPRKAFAREIHPGTGQPTRTLASPPDDSAGVLSVRDFERLAIDWDGSFVVNRSWSNAECACLRRFGPDGRRVPLWPGQRIKTGESYGGVEWPKLPSQPGRLPDSALFSFGWDGSFWVADHEGTHVAKYQRDGRLIGVLPLQPNVFARIDAIQAARDGTLLILFKNRQKIGDDEWMHVARVLPTGQVQISFGAHVGDASLVGKYDDRLKALPDGRFFVGSDFDSLRGYAPDGSLFFATPQTRRRTTRVLEDLAKVRRGKRLVQDSG